MFGISVRRNLLQEGRHAIKVIKSIGLLSNYTGHVGISTVSLFVSENIVPIWSDE